MHTFAVESMVHNSDVLNWTGFDLFATQDLAIKFAKQCIHCAKVNNPDLVVECEFTDKHQQFKAHCEKSGKTIFIRILHPTINYTVPKNFYSWW